MSAQAQECVFEGLLLQASGAAHDCLAQLHLAQEAAQVRAGWGGGCPGGGPGCGSLVPAELRGGAGRGCCSVSRSQLSS